MRHRVKGKKLNRTAAHKKAMLRNMAKSFLTYGRIRTTETKAKELRKVVERLVTFGLENSVAARREAYRVLENHGLVKKLFDEIAPRFKKGQGGFTRVVKFGLPRKGDAAPMALIEFVDFGAVLETKKTESKVKTVENADLQVKSEEFTKDVKTEIENKAE